MGAKAGLKLKKNRIALCGFLFLIGCSKYTGRTDQPTASLRSEIVAAEAALIGLNSSLMETEGSYLNATCNSSVTYRTCSLYSGSDYKAIYNWNTCTFDSGRVTVAGTWWSFFYNDATTTCPVPNAVGKQVKRITVGSGVVKYQWADGQNIQMTTEQDPSFPGQPLGSDGILTLQQNSSTRQLRINAMGIKRSSAAGMVIYDTYLHSGNSGTQMTVTGTLPSSNRVLNGTTHVYFKESQRALLNFNNVAWTDAACCFPRSGSIALSFDDFNPASPTAWPNSGKTATVMFSNTCGQATLIGVDGASVPHTFSECF